MAVVLLAALAVLAVLAWRTTVDPRIVYLRHEAGARWIRADRPFELRSWKDAALLRTSVFRVAFESSGSWSRAELAPELALRALTAVVVRLDGVVLHDDRDDVRRIDWRELRRIPFPAGLAAGRHELEITVTNPAGPALLLAHCDALSLRSGSAWTAKVGDAKWAPALDASVMPTPELAQAFPPVADAVGLLVPWIASIFVVVALASGAWPRRWLPARARNRPWSSDAFAALVAVAWIVLIVNNLPRLPPSMGMDAQGHLEYIDHLTKHGTIPLASDGWQMFQPPLYYALSVLFVKPILGLVSVPSLHRALRLLPMLCGLATALLCHRVSRAVFPQRADLGTIATCVGALMPMSLAISQCVGNEPLTATFTAWALALAVEALRDPALAARPRWQVTLGLVLGLGLLTKPSVLVVVPPLLAAGVTALRRHGATRGVVVRAIARTGAVCAAVSGWYYVRNWIRLGRPFVGGWEADRGIAWWQDPGYRTWEQYTSFGESLIRPIYAGSNGLWDGLHSTLWLDGMLSGKVSGTFPPWNLAPLLAGAWLGLIPLALILLGGMRALFRTVRGESDGLSFCMVAVCAGLVAVIGISLTVPTYSSIKATYLLGFLPCFGVLAAAGYEWLARPAWTRPLLAGAVACWAVIAYAAYFAVE